MEWPPCITQACIPPEWLETEVVGRAREEGENTLIELLPLQYVSVLMMRRQHEIRQTWMQTSKNESRTYPFDQLVGPLPRKLPTTTTFRELTRSQWKWPDRFRLNLIEWLNALQWIDAPGQVTFLELALDFEARKEQKHKTQPGGGQRNPKFTNMAEVFDVARYGRGG